MLCHAERLLRSLGGCLEDEGFSGFSATPGTPSQRAALSLRVPDETQLALYESSGAFYRPHRDQYRPKWSDGPFGWLQLRRYGCRVLTAILYLNDNAPGSERPWCAQDGGCLRVYFDGRAPEGAPTGAADAVGAPDGRSTTPYYVDIPPVGGRLVVFDSQELLHEVRPAHADRAALTVWFVER